MASSEFEKYWRTQQEDFAQKFANLTGKTIKSVHPNYGADEGFILEFTDGTLLDIGYSGEEGFIEWKTDKSGRREGATPKKAERD